MMTSSPTSGGAEHQAAVTQLLVRAQGGDAKATDELFPIVYEELRGWTLRAHNVRGADVAMQTIESRS